MKQGKTLQELATELDRQVKSKKDYVAPTDALSLTAHVGHPTKLNLAGVGDFEINKTCHDQFAARLGIPSKYYDRMKIDAPGLLADNVNHWLAANQEKRMVRTLDGRARAFLSDRYRPLDNFNLAEAVLPKLMELNCKVESCELTESKMYIKAICLDIEEKIDTPRKVGDVIRAGVYISNSEIGAGSLAVDPFTEILSCLNGARHQAFGMKKYHVGRRSEETNFAQEFYRSETRIADDRAFFMKVQDLVSGTLSKDGFGKIMLAYKRAQKIQIEADPVKVVEVLAEKNQLSDDERGGVLKYLVGGGDMSLYGLMNAVTRFSQDVEDYDRATDFEKLGGSIVELPQNQIHELVSVR